MRRDSERFERGYKQTFLTQKKKATKSPIKKNKKKSPPPQELFTDSPVLFPDATWNNPLGDTEEPGPTQSGTDNPRLAG